MTETDDSADDAADDEVWGIGFIYVVMILAERFLGNSEHF